MEKNKKMVVMVKIASLLFLMGFSATVEASRQLDPSFVIAQVLNKGEDANKFLASTEEECCKSCVAKRSYPEIVWQCQDVAESCPAACERCFCTRSIPPRCRCADTASGNCYIPQCT